jgi:hypothetical protein
MILDFLKQLAIALLVCVYVATMVVWAVKLFS